MTALPLPVPTELRIGGGPADDRFLETKYIAAGW